MDVPSAEASVFAGMTVCGLAWWFADWVGGQCAGLWLFGRVACRNPDGLLFAELSAGPERLEVEFVEKRTVLLEAGVRHKDGYTPQNSYAKG